MNDYIHEMVSLRRTCVTFKKSELVAAQCPDATCAPDALCTSELGYNMVLPGFCVLPYPLLQHVVAGSSRIEPFGPTSVAACRPRALMTFLDHFCAVRLLAISDMRVWKCLIISTTLTTVVTTCSPPCNPQSCDASLPSEGNADSRAPLPHRWGPRLMS